MQRGSDAFYQAAGALFRFQRFPGGPDGGVAAIIRSPGKPTSE